MRAACLVFVALTFNPAISKGSASESTLVQGLTEARNGNCQAALSALGVALTRTPDNVPALTASGLCESMLGRPERATANFERVVQLRPQAWQAWNNLGANYLALDRTADAERAFRKAVALNPNAGSAWFNLASILLRTGDRSEAFRALDRAQQADPGDAQLQQTWLHLAADIASDAGSQIDKGQYAPAYAELSLVKRPLQNTASWNNLIGYAEFKLRKDEDARNHLQIALRKDPENEDYLLDIGEFLAAHHAFQELETFFDVGAKRMPNSRRVRFGLAISYILEDRRDDATRLLESLRFQYPDWEPAYRALGECYEDAGNWPVLLQLGQTLETKNPETPLGWYFEGAAEERLSGQNGSASRAAIDALKHAVALDASSSRYHFELGKVYANTNDLQAAIRQLKQAIRLDPDHQRAHYVLARVYQRLGESQLAKLEFRTHSGIKAQGEKDAYLAMLTANEHLSSETSATKVK
jgi:Flp pilus assembly protein TadD